MSTSWQDDPFAFDDLFDEEFDREEIGDPSPKKTRRRLVDRSVLALCLVALVGAISAVVIGGRDDAGWLAVVVGGLAYLSAAGGDLRLRSIRHRKHNYKRPWLTAALRVIVFLTAAAAAWLAARGLATP